MVRLVEYTETYRDTLVATVSLIATSWGDKYVHRFLDKLDGLISKIQEHPFMYQALPTHPEYRRCVISKQTSLVYMVTDQKIILLHLFDNRQDALWR